MTIVTKYWKLILILLLFIGLAMLFRDNVRQRAEKNRLKANQENLTALNERELVLRRNEYRQLNTAWKDKLDSVLKDNKIKLRNVQNATVMQTAYKDTAKKPVVYGTPIVTDNPTVSNPVLVQEYYKIPIQQNTECWGVKGFLNSVDPGCQLEITERTGLNSIQLVVIRKRFLGFLWMTKKTDFKAFSDCGSVDVTKIEFKK